MPVEVRLTQFTASLAPMPQPSTESRKEVEPLALVMKGGGAKGLAYVGALEVLEEVYDFNWYIGTSAGAIAAVLLAAGYSPEELREIFKAKDFHEFLDSSRFSQLPRLIFSRGLHEAATFTTWVDELLAQKLHSRARVRLSDLPHRCTVFASRRGKRALKFDSVDADADAAYAVRCSMSIPFLFTPQSEQGIRTFDGGLQNNFPVEALLTDYPGTKFVSLFLGSETYEHPNQKWVLADLLSIWTEATDREVLEKYADQTVIIDPRPIGTLSFRLTAQEKDFLLEAGRAAALGHLDASSDAYHESASQRDKLKSAVVSARAESRRRTKSRRRKRIWLFVLLTLIAFASHWYYRSLAPWLVTNSISMTTAIQRLCDANSDGEMSEQVEAIKGEVVEWTGTVAEVATGRSPYLIFRVSSTTRAEDSASSCQWTVRVYLSGEFSEVNRLNGLKVSIRGKISDVITAGGFNIIEIDPARIESSVP
jgi:predicted acylesterase/phospholipase RssA